MLDGTGYPVMQLSIDIDGQTREILTPDIGADEFTNTLNLNLPADTFFCSSGFLDAQSPGSTYNWSNGANSQSIQILSTGTYWVEVSNACGTITDTTHVAILSELIVDLGPDTIICNGNPYYLDAGYQNANYNWSNGSNLQSITVNNSGSYWVEINNGNCVGSDTVLVTFNAMPVSQFSVNTPVCEGDSSMVQFIGTASGFANYIWNFDGGNGSPGIGIGPHYVNWQTAGTYTISLVVEDNGCTSSLSSDSVLVMATPSSDFIFSSNSICGDDTCSVIYVGNGSTNATYNWNFGQATLLNGTGQGPYQLQYINPGIHPVTLSVEENGCISQTYTDSIEVGFVPDASFILSNANICSSDTIVTTYTGNASVGAQFIWNFSGGNIINGSDQGPYTLVYSTPGTQTISLLIDEGTCSSEEYQANLEIFSIPTSDFSLSNSMLCSTDTLIMTYTGTATNSGNFVWNFDGADLLSGNNQGPFECQWDSAGSYMLTLQVEENGCQSDQSQQQIDIILSPTSEISITNPVCVDEEALLTYLGNATSSATYDWNTDGSTINPFGQGPHNVSWNSEGIKTVTLEVEEAGCWSEQSIVQVTVNPLPEQPVINLTDNIFTSSSSDNNQWLLNGAPISGATSQFHIATATGFYQVEVSNIYGCVAISDMIYFDYTAIDNYLSDSEINIYPNPANQFIFIDAGGYGRTVKFSLYSLTGGELDLPFTGHTNLVYRVDLSQVVPGTYIMKIYNDEIISFRKILKH